jgi:hypothetical protein
MAYAAEHGHVATLKAQLSTLQKKVARLDMIRENVRRR